MIFNEGLEKNEMGDLIDNVISIDQYKPKVGTDTETVVVSFTLKYEKPAEDLADFINTSHIEQLDVEASSVPNETGDHKVFVEFERDEKLINKIIELVYHIQKLDNNISWKYIYFKSDGEKDLTKENLQQDVITDQKLYDRLYKEKSEKEKVKERLEFLVKY